MDQSESGTRGQFIDHVKVRAVELGIVSLSNVEQWFTIVGIVRASERTAIAAFVAGSQDEVIRTFLKIIHGGFDVRFASASAKRV